MSLLLRRLSKLASPKATALVSFFRQRHLTTRFFSTCYSQTLPCSIAGAQHCGSTFRDTENVEIGKYCGLNYVTEKKEMGTVGSCNGWVATLKQGVVCLQDDLVIPNASDTDPKRISLPPLVALPHCQTQIVTNVAMSSSSPEDDDCVVAVKFLGPQLSLYRLGRGNSEWTNVRITDSSFFNSQVMYSKRDEMFSMVSSEGHYIGSWDIGEHIHNRKVQKLRFRNLPKLAQGEWEMFDSCWRSEHLVESRTTGEMFLVKWYTKRDKDDGKMKTERLFVFNIDEQGNAEYTRDIGDLIIWLSKAESFCLPASFHKGYDNFINFLGIDHDGFATIYDHTSTTNFCCDCTSITPPYWIPRRKID